MGQKAWFGTVLDHRHFSAFRVKTKNRKKNRRFGSPGVSLAPLQSKDASSVADPAPKVRKYPHLGHPKTPSKRGVAGYMDPVGDSLNPQSKGPRIGEALMSGP